MLLLPSIRSGGTLPYSGYTSSDGIIHGDLAAIDSRNQSGMWQTTMVSRP